ncbi:CDP-alcohol phosphatidyltransferase family protein [Salinactinospora qingdaonensis]|uniref:CDP-alcohol phosphatidyltransferase family protein n=1 Tax=Salinactinospora qingdaonensis TaxID=702744 RepID=A0ABP7FWC6_9ACTN
MPRIVAEAGEWRNTVTIREQGGAGTAAGEPTVGVVGQVAVLASLWASVGLGPVGWVAGTGYAVAGGALLTVGLHRSGGWSLGPADRVTLARAVLVGGVTALVAEALATDGGAQSAPVAILVVLAVTALALDGVDGYVARRTGTVSALGARFDMEVDAFLILVLSVFVAGSLGAWVLAIGVMRYAFAAAARGLPWLRTTLPPSMARKTVAAVQGVVLTVAAAGVLAQWLAMTVVALALAALVWSFGRDVGWLWRNRHRPAGLA